MSHTRPPLSPRQLAVLEWIADGCPNGIWPDHSHKLSVGMLETRNLASVRRWYGKWNAILQPDGQYYLDHGTYPDPEPSATVKPAVVSRPPIPRSPRSRTTQLSKPPTISGQFPQAKPTSASAQLIAEILAAGGSLTVTPANDNERLSLQARIRAIDRSDKLPSGMRLVVEKPRWETFILKITELPTWMSNSLLPVHVSAQVRNPHASIIELRDHPHRLAVSGPARQRALRLLQALVAIATGRGHSVHAITSHTDSYGRHLRTPEQLRFGVAGYEIGLRIAQLNDRTDHVPTTKELAYKQRYSFATVPRYDYTPSDRLKIELTGSYQQGTWTDRTRHTLEDKLPEIWQAIERCADAAERARLQADERRRQEQIADEQRVARAKVKLVEANRQSTLDDQLTAWLRARHLDNYLDAMEAVVEQIDDPTDGVAASEWLAWARHHAQRIDPLNHRLAMPCDPEPTHATLAAFMER